MTNVQAAIMPATKAPRVSAMTEDRSDALHALVMQQLDDDQAQDIVSIDLAGKSSMADHMVVASGRSTRQVASIAQKLAEKIKQDGYGSVRLEGLPAADCSAPKCAASTISSGCGPLARTARSLPGAMPDPGC